MVPEALSNNWMQGIASYKSTTCSAGHPEDVQLKRRLVHVLFQRLKDNKSEHFLLKPQPLADFEIFFILLLISLPLSSSFEEYI